MKMSAYLFFIILLGIVAGYVIFPDKLVNYLDLMINIVLFATLFIVGVGIGQNKRIFLELKKIGGKIILLPMGTIIGSLMGGAVAGFLLGRSLFLSLAISSGFGWYSISAGLLFQTKGIEASAIGFLANVFREILAFLLIPVVAKKVSAYAAVSIGGATSMDTTLPVISRSAGEKYVLVSFIHGSLLSILVPFLVELFGRM